MRELHRALIIKEFARTAGTGLTILAALYNRSILAV